MESEQREGTNTQQPEFVQGNLQSLAAPPIPPVEATRCHEACAASSNLSISSIAEPADWPLLILTVICGVRVVYFTPFGLLTSQGRCPAPLLGFCIPLELLQV
jgi:hypothetical protein